MIRRAPARCRAFQKPGTCFMSSQSKIEWCDATWNPVRGCDKISPGCARCYSEAFSERWRGIPGHPYEQGFDLRLVPDKLDEPFKWKKGRRIFVNSMSDLFHEGVPAEYIKKVFDVMVAANHHIYMILTKRHERMLDLMSCYLARYSAQPHIWLGVSAENERYGLPRIEALCQTPCRFRFLSCEPLIGPIDLFKCSRIGNIRLVIVGGESGPGCRSMDPAWARSLRDQCRERGMLFFMKQMSGNPKGRTPIPDDLMIRELP